MRRNPHPTPASLKWWRTTLSNVASAIVRYGEAFDSPREDVICIYVADVDRRRAAQERALRGEAA